MPLLLKHINPLRGIWQIEETVGELQALLGPESIYYKIPENLRTEKRQQEWLSTRLLLRELLGEESPVAYHPNGAPYLPEKPYFLSISHTRGYAAVLLHDSPCAGIDIEYRSDRIRKIRDKFLSLEEILSIDPEHETSHLLLYWCAKETLFKMISREDVDFRLHLHIESFPFSLSGTITAYETHTQYRNHYTLGYAVHPEYVWVWGK